MRVWTIVFRGIGRGQRVASIGASSGVELSLFVPMAPKIPCCEAAAVTGIDVVWKPKRHIYNCYIRWKLASERVQGNDKPDNQMGSSTLGGTSRIHEL